MSAFDLAQAPSELPSFNANVGRVIYEQYPPLRDVSGTNFSGGMIDIRWEVSGNKWWVPSRSYLRMRAKLFQADGTTPVTLADGVAPNMGLMANLFTSAELQIGGKTVSRVSELMPQIDALNTRLHKSKSWLDGIGKLNWWQPRIEDRLAHVTSDSQGHTITDNVQDIPSQDFGFGATMRLTYTDATHLITFTVAAPDVIAGAQRLYPGDKLVITAAANGYVVGDVFTIEQVLTAVTAKVLFTRGADVAPGEATFSVRRAPQASEKRNGFEMIWQPPLSLFNIDKALPAGQYRLLLNPKPASQFQLDAVESSDVNKVAGAAGDFVFEVDNMYMYIQTVLSDRVDDLTYFLSLDQIRCQTDQIRAGTSLQQRFFDVSPSTYALAFALQDQAISNDTRRSASKFKIRSSALHGQGQDLNISRLFLNYGGVNKPQPDADPDFFSDPTVNYLSQLYATTNLYSGMYFNPGGAESEEDWRERGPYYFYQWPRDGSSESTRVTCNFQLNPAVPVDTGNVLLFDLSHKVVRVTIKQGRVIEVNEQDA